MGEVDHLAGQVAIVTGAGTGLGRAIAVALAEAGADLLLHFRTHGRAVESLAAECRALGRRVEIEQADFASDPGLAATVVRTAFARYGRVDILVNNAAVTTKMAPFEVLTREVFEETLAVNLTAPFLATQAAAQVMVPSGRGGRIINIGSVHAQMSVPGAAAYDASKGGIQALTAASAIALGRHRITVNCVAPGAIVVERYADTAWDDAWSVSRTPIGRNGRPEDVAAAVCFLVSEDAEFVTGATLVVDGGMTRFMPLAR